MPAYTPEEVPLLFAQALSAGDLETLISLYEAEATLLAQPGEAPVKGTEDIRAALGCAAQASRWDMALRHRQPLR